MGVLSVRVSSIISAREHLLLVAPQWQDIAHVSDVPGRLWEEDLGFGISGLTTYTPQTNRKPIQSPFRRTVVLIGPFLGFHVSFRECKVLQGESHRGRSDKMWEFVGLRHLWS